MTLKRSAYLIGLLAAVASAAYLFVYLYRWEWNRALIAGMFFVATEVGLAAAAILDRLRAIEVAIEQGPTGTALTHLRDTAPPPRDHFAWLSPTSGATGVFVPVLMGAGVVLSLVAWVVERVARATARPVLEQGLARRLAPLCLPPGGFVDQGNAALSLLRGPVGSAKP